MSMALVLIPHGVRQSEIQHGGIVNSARHRRRWCREDSVIIAISVTVAHFNHYLLLQLTEEIREYCGSFNGGLVQRPSFT
jgi:hypothetical protein